MANKQICINPRSFEDRILRIGGEDIVIAYKELSTYASNWQLVNGYNVQTVADTAHQISVTLEDAATSERYTVNTVDFVGGRPTDR